VINLKHEMERELSRIDPPDLWDRIQADAADLGDADVVDLSTSRHGRRPSLWLAVAAAAMVLALIGALTLFDDDQAVDTTPVNEVPLPPSFPGWAGAVREPSDEVHRLTGMRVEDPPDAAEPWVDLTLVTAGSDGGGMWRFFLAEEPPRLDLVEPGVVIALGVTFDTDADGTADYVVSLDTDASEPPGFRAWVTDLATGETDMQDGGPYGYPVEFGFPTIGEPDIPVFLTFLQESAAPADLDPGKVRFYAWTVATRDGAVFAHDYAPDTGWVSRSGE